MVGMEDHQAQMDEAGQVHAELRPLLFSIAYRMLGSVAEAEDVVQEAFLRWHRALTAGTQVESPKAYLAAVTTRLAIDHLRASRARRESRRRRSGSPSVGGTASAGCFSGCSRAVRTWACGCGRWR